MDTFPIIKRKDQQQYGTFRTKELILEVYDAMAEAMLPGLPAAPTQQSSTLRRAKDPATRISRVRYDQMADGQVRYAQIVWETLDILRDTYTYTFA